MSLSFLHRLVSSLTQAKMSNDRAQLAKGRALMSMPNFIVLSMENQYGIRSIAMRYLQV